MDLRNVLCANRQDFLEVRQTSTLRFIELEEMEHLLVSITSSANSENHKTIGHFSKSTEALTCSQETPQGTSAWLIKRSFPHYVKCASTESDNGTLLTAELTFCSNKQHILCYLFSHSNIIEQMDTRGDKTVIIEVFAVSHYRNLFL